MLNSIRDFKERFIKEHLFEVKYITRDEYNEIYGRVKENVYHEVREDGQDEYYIKEAVKDIPDEDLKIYLDIKMFKFLEEANKSLSTIKAIMIIWLILAIIGFIAALPFAIWM